MADEKGFSTFSPVAIAKAIAAMVEKVPGIAGIGSGIFAEVATYGPGTKVEGVVVGLDHDQVTVEIHVIVAGPGPYPRLNLIDLADRVRREVLRVLEKLHIDVVGRVDVVFDDVSP
ncbi:MAG: hypothetical protein SGJ16_13530 [Nitrospirota bacterium]|nr:hypothetical protein [Nitrospirota bacterium]